VWNTGAAVAKPAPAPTPTPFSSSRISAILKLSYKQIYRNSPTPGKTRSRNQERPQTAAEIKGVFFLPNSVHAEGEIKVDCLISRKPQTSDYTFLE